MTESITTHFSNMDLETDGTSVSDHIDLEVTIQGLIERCKTMYDEVETYVAAVIAKQKQTRFKHHVEYRNLRDLFKNELAFLNRIASKSMDEEKARHFIVSSNLLYYETLWGAAKRSSGLLAFRKYFHWDKRGKTTTKRKGGGAKGKNNALVDIVADEGAEWLRVSALSEKRLLFDLAKLGWMNDSDSDDDMPDARPMSEDDDDDDDQVDIVKHARQLARAARANPIRGRPPRVHFILTRIIPGKSKEIDGILNKIRATGATVQCANDIPPAPPLEVVLPKLLIDRSRALSDTLNIDCTILMALISDISHQDCPILDWYPGEVRAQIQEEAEENLLPTHLYPAISSHPMVTTKEAVDQMYLIVQTLATDAEKNRADLLLGQGDHAAKSSEQIVSEWQAMSKHTIPEDFQLPIRIVPSNANTVKDRLPAVAATLFDELGELNRAIFLYGWAEGLTTLSANRGRARQIESVLNEQGLEEGEDGPHIWLCGESRSLIAKHGRRK